MNMLVLINHVTNLLSFDSSDLRVHQSTQMGFAVFVNRPRNKFVVARPSNELMEHMSLAS